MTTPNDNELEVKINIAWMLFACAPKRAEMEHKRGLKIEMV